MVVEVYKYGGTSMGESSSYARVALHGQGLLSKVDMPVIVVSAPALGKKDSERVTELLQQSYNLTKEGKQIESQRLQISRLFEYVAGEHFDRQDFNMALDQAVQREKSSNTLALGEHYQAKSLANYLQEKRIPTNFVDARQAIKIENEKIVSINQELFESNTLNIIGGFYGSNEFGDIEVLNRGGSDNTADNLGAKLKASKVVFLKDVDGIKVSDPDIFKGTGITPRTLREVSPETIREMSYGGARVLSAEAMRECRNSGIPQYVRHVDYPFSGGTRIGKVENKSIYPISGIVTQPGFTILNFPRINEINYLTDVLAVLSDNEISFDMLTTNNGSYSLTIDSREPITAEVINNIQSITSELERVENQALVSVVGEIDEPRPFKAGLLHNLREFVNPVAIYGALIWEPETYVFDVNKFGMHGERGFGKKLTQIFADRGASITIASTTIDSISLGTKKELPLEDIVYQIEEELDVDSVIISTEGRRLFGPRRKISNISLAVPEDKRHEVVKRLYNHYYKV
ncbi:MAG: hypothetical protein Q8Q35_02480 [Nanoarchaeota archaeon]|nr:hypothetical protein [Nanoarchaeota archaeon]